MSRRKSTRKESIDRLSGQVYIHDNARVNIQDSVIGGDQIILQTFGPKAKTLLDHLIQIIGQEKSLSSQDKRSVITKSKELVSELKNPKLDPGKIVALKEFLVSKGSLIAASTSAIFSYPPGQESIKLIAKNILGA